VDGVLADSRLEPVPPTRVVIDYVCHGDPKTGFKWERVERTVEQSGLQPHYYTQLPVRATVRKGDFKWKKLESKNKYYAEKLMPGFDDVPFASDREDKVNLECGFRKRLAPLMPLPDLKILEEIRIFVRKVCHAYLVPLKYRRWDKSFVGEWLSQIDHYNGQRKKQLLDAAERVVMNGLNECDYIIKAFVKNEFYECEKFIRWICSRLDTFKSYVGPYIKLAEREIFGKFSCFVKHMTPDEIALKLHDFKGDKRKLETDYSSFESGFSPEYVDVVECELWRYMFQDNPEVLDAIMKVYYQDKNGVIKPRRELIKNKFCTMQVMGCRMSGEMWTSLANGFSNMINILFLAEKKGINIHHLLIEGDDGLTGLDSEAFSESDFEQLGFKIKIEYAKDMRDTFFCGICVDDEGNLVCSIEQICRFPWSNAPCYFKCPRHVKIELLRAKAMSLFCLGRHTPIAGVLATQVIKLIGLGKFRCPDAFSSWKMQTLDRFTELFSTDKVHVTQSARFLFAHKYNISVELQLSIERFILSCHSLEELYIPMVLRFWNFKALRHVAAL